MYMLLKSPFSPFSLTVTTKKSIKLDQCYYAKSIVRASAETCQPFKAGASAFYFRFALTRFTILSNVIRGNNKSVFVIMKMTSWIHEHAFRWRSVYTDDGQSCYLTLFSEYFRHESLFTFLPTSTRKFKILSWVPKAFHCTDCRWIHRNDTDKEKLFHKQVGGVT